MNKLDLKVQPNCKQSYEINNNRRKSTIKKTPQFTNGFHKAYHLSMMGVALILDIEEKSITQFATIGD